MAKSKKIIIFASAKQQNNYGKLFGFDKGSLLGSLV